LIEISSDENDIVLDPFMWVWSTWVACKELNRKFIWIELDRNYFEASKKRLWVKENVKFSEELFKQMGIIRELTMNQIKSLRLEFVSQSALSPI
jgi:DNA modification methylase